MAPKRRIYIKSRSGMGKKPVLRLPEKYSTVLTNNFPEVQRVQGIMPDSKEEYWVALALYKLKIDFIFQYQLFGGRKYKGVIPHGNVSCPIDVGTNQLSDI